MPPYRNAINHLQTGSPSTAGNLSGPDRELESNVRHLKALVESALLGEALFLRDVTVEEDALVGMPVYWDTTEQKYLRALATAEIDPATGAVVGAASSQVVGLVYSKSLADKATLLIAGTVVLDIALAGGGTAAGRYYLSSVTPGGLTRTRPAVAVPVLHAVGDGRVVFAHALREFNHDHAHYSFALTCAPAGTTSAPSPGGRHEIDDPDDALPGWLPADHAAFDGNAPANAAFGYNIAADADLAAAWPPIPPDAAGLIWDKGADAVGGTVVPLGANGLALIDRNGIWWLSDCYGDVPWPTAYTSSAFPASDGFPPECPREEEMRLRVEFTRPAFAAGNGAVTSLVSRSPFLSITDCDDNPASTGPLEIDLLLELLADEDAAVLGSLVVKEFDAETKTLKFGRAVEGVIAGSNVSITSSHSRRLTPGDVDTPLVHQGIFTLNALTAQAGGELPVVLVKLDDALVRYVGALVTLALPDGDDTEIYGQIHVPPAGLPDDPTLKIRVEFYAPAAGTFPSIALTRRVVPAATGTPAALPSDEEATAFSSSTVLADAARYFAIESEEFEVVPGDTVHFRLARDAGDGYAAEAHILRIGAVVGEA
jgi:hypothetical protein